jgi:hypothetical protein
MSSQTTFLRQDFRDAIAWRRNDIVIECGLALGAILGMLGTFVSSPSIRAEAWTIDGVGLVVATCLLAIRCFRHGEDCVAGGFLVFALGEAVMLVGNSAGLQGSVPSFQAGTALWAAGLLLTATPKVFAWGTRLASVIAATLFAIVSARIAWGETILPVTKPLPNYAYPFLVLTLAGWFWHVVKRHR